MKRDDIFKTLREKGDTITKADLLEIQVAITRVPVEEWLEVVDEFYECLYLTVSAPEYTGDLTLDYLEQA